MARILPQNPEEKRPTDRYDTEALFRERLDALRAEGSLRKIGAVPFIEGQGAALEGLYGEKDPASCKRLNLLSNDYLGLSENKTLKTSFDAKLSDENLPYGSTGSRLLSGNFLEAEALEKEIATALGKASALLFNSGYHANFGILAALGTIPTVHFVADRLCHASIMDGLILSRRPFQRFRHNDYQHLEQIVSKLQSKEEVFPIVVIVESLYSMDGDEADLQQLVTIKKRFSGVMLYVDEAHAIGVRGENGYGIAEESKTLGEIDFLVGTFGKALAGMGAYLAASHPIVQYMVNTARAFIFSTMLPPALIAWDRFVFGCLPALRAEREHLHALAKRLRELMAEKDYPDLGTSHIIPLHYPGNERCTTLASYLCSEGFDVRPIRYPTVARGSERIRLSLSLSSTISFEALERLAATLPPYSSTTTP